MQRELWLRDRFVVVVGCPGFGVVVEFVCVCFVCSCVVLRCFIVWCVVRSWIVVIIPCLISKLSINTLTTGAKQFVVQEAAVTKSCLEGS